MLCPIERKKPYLGPDPNYSKALYYDAPSHDFLTWLVIAEGMRRLHKSPGPLNVRFLYLDGQLGKYDFGSFGILANKARHGYIQPGYSSWMVERVCKPGIAMMEAFQEPDLHMPTELSLIHNYVEYDYHVAQLVDAVKAGFKVPYFHPPRWAEEEVDEVIGNTWPITITLREMPLQPERNSNIGAWLKFAADIKKTHRVIFIRDTAQADQPFEGGWETCRRASENAFVRLALYKRAYCNLMVCNGPVGWCSYSDAPVLVFKQLVPAIPGWEAGEPKGWKEQFHLEVGEQLPWYLPTQRFTWTDDRYENIHDAFEQFTGAQCS